MDAPRLIRSIYMNSISKLLIVAATTIPFYANAKYYVQPVVKKEFNVDSMYYSSLDMPSYVVESENTIVRDMRDGVDVANIQVSVIEQNGYDITFKVSNHTMRWFSDINLVNGRSGFTIDSELKPFTEKVITVKNTLFDNDNLLKFLDPNPLFHPNSTRYHEYTDQDHVNAYFSIQNNLKVAYGQAETYDDYMSYFTNDRNEIRRNAWSKWFHTVSYNVPKEYRQHNKTGTSGGWWHAIGGKHLKKLFTMPEYTGVYGFFSHENAHSMGFKHDSGMAYGWDNGASHSVWKAIDAGLVQNASVLPQTNNFFLTYDDKQDTLQLFKKAGANFEGFERLNAIYDSTKVHMAGGAGSFDTVFLDTKTNDESARIVINGKIKGQPNGINLVIRGQQVGVSPQEEFEQHPDSTIDNYEQEEAAHQQKVKELELIFPESNMWAFNTLDSNLVKVKHKSEQRILCKFQQATQGLERTTYLGVVDESLNVCTVGEDNTAAGVKGFASATGAFQTVNLDNPDLEEGFLKVDYTQQDRMAEVCVYADDNVQWLHGVGFIQENGTCSANMIAGNGRGWGMSRNFKKVLVQKPLDEGLTQHDAWGWSDQVAERIAIELNGEQRDICRFAAGDVQEFGYVNDLGQCTVGEHNSLNGVKNFSVDHYQVAKANYGEQGTHVPAPINGEEWSICYREGLFAGVSVSRDNVSCGKHYLVGKTAYSGAGYGFSKNNGFAFF